MLALLGGTSRLWPLFGTNGRRRTRDEHKGHAVGVGSYASVMLQVLP